MTTGENLLIEPFGLGILYAFASSIIASKPLGPDLFVFLVAGVFSRVLIEPSIRS